MSAAPYTPTTVIPRHQQPIPLLFFGGGDETLDNGSRYNPAVISFIRDQWLYEQVKSREPEFTEYRALRLFVGTWNVNGKMPKESLSAWLTDGVGADGSGSDSGAADLPDVYVVGLQEMVDLTVTNVALGAQSKKASQQWLQLLDQALNDNNPAIALRSPDDRYECIGTRYLVGVNIAVYVRARFRPFVSEVQDAEAPVGVMGVMGNKGGVSLRLKIFDTTLCFVCAHLAAHRGAVAQRNADFASIMAKTEFKDEARAEAGTAAAAAGSLAASELGKISILDHEHVIWFGDFNYRIVETVSTEKCFELAEGGEADLEQLRVRDQLNIERAAQRSFHGFQEGPLTFRPTYKFQPGTSLYEQRPDKKLRAPAWCDRILWRSSPDVDPKSFRQLYYGSVDSLMTSDHKPVHALFEVAAKTVLQPKKEAVVRDITRQLDAMENRQMPKVTVSDTSIALKDVVYGLPLSKAITIKNTGNVAATWRFVPKPEEMHFCKTWLSVEPAYGMIVPGDTVTVTFTVTVDDAVARDISLGRELAFPSLTAGAGAAPTASGAGAAAMMGGLLEDILILRMERGRDFYLSVSASVLPTCFGCSLSQLARRPEPMRALSLTVAATSAINSSAGIALGQSPMAAAAGGAGGASPRDGLREIRAPVDLAAGSHTLANLVGGDEEELTPGALAARAAAGSGGVGVGMDLTSSLASLHTGANLLSLSSSDITRKGSQLMSVPKEIWRLVDAIWSRGMESRGLFLAPGNPAEIIEVREALDTGDAIPASADPLSIAEVLCDLLESLREPVIPVIYFPLPQDLKAMGVEGWTGQMLRNIAPLHYNVLVYLVRFGREVLAHGHANGCSNVEDLSFVLSRCMMRRIPHDEAPAHIEPASGSGSGSGASAEGGASSGGSTLGGLFGGGKGGSSGSAAADEGAEEGAAIARLSLYADKGTRWEPTKEEQEMMTRIFSYLLTTAPLA